MTSNAAAASTVLPPIQATRGARTVHAGYEMGGQWFTKCGQNQLRTIQFKITYVRTDAQYTCPKCIAQREA